MSPLAGSSTPLWGGWGAEEVGIDWNTVMTLLEEVEDVADETLDVGDVEYDEVWFVLVADVLALGETGDDVDVACLDENEA